MPISQIETARLLLRPFVLAELADLHRLWTAAEVRRYLFDDEIISRDQTEAEIARSLACYQEHGHGLWSIRLKSEPALIGFCGYRFFHEPPELQLLYGLAPNYWSQGLATEAARAMIRYGFDELGFTEIVASADAPNRASLRVMEKAGMKFEKRVTINGLETIYYQLQRADFIPAEACYQLQRD